MIVHCRQQNRDLGVSLMALWSLYYQAWATHLWIFSTQEKVSYMFKSTIIFRFWMMGKSHMSLDCLKFCFRVYHLGR